MTSESVESDEDFTSIFSPIAFHFFPDGRPHHVDELALGGAWPHRLKPSASRTIVSSKEAQTSLPALHGFCKRGLTSSQLSAIVVVACEMLSSKSIRSPLACERHFHQLLRCWTLKSGHVMHKDAVLQVTSCLNVVRLYCQRIILRFLYLVAQIQELPNEIYPLLVAHAQGGTCVDAVRLLLRCTKHEHVKVYMARRIRNRLDRAMEEGKKLSSSSSNSPSSSSGIQALSALLCLYGRLNPDCQEYVIPIRNRNYDLETSWYENPESEWEQDFFAPREHLESATKRRHLGRVIRLDGAVDLPTGRDTASTYSFLENHNLHHRVVLSNQIDDEELERVKTILPYLLKEYLYSKPSSNTMESHVVTMKRMLSSMHTFALQTDSLLPEFQDFVESSVLPAWDGTGTVLPELLAGWSPCSFAEFQSRVLVHLEKFLLSGDSYLQYRVTCAFTLLADRWGRLDWTASGNKLETLRELILWVDTILVKAFVMSSDADNFDNDEILRSAAIQFYATISDLSVDCGFLGAPSAPLFYRLLLARSAISIDRLCHLLVSYKRIFQILKDQANTAVVASVSEANEERIRLYNCYVWDTCSVLWRCTPPPHPHNDADAQPRAFSLLFTNLRLPTQMELHRLSLLPEQEHSIVAKALSITHGAVFVGFAHDFIRQEFSTDNHDALSLIRGKMKVQYLDYLKNCGFSGLHVFLSTFVGSLANRSKQ